MGSNVHEMALATVVAHDHSPSLAFAAKQLGVRTSDVDNAYGVVPLDPVRGLYAVLVRADRLQPPSEEDTFQGPYSNPKISSF